MTAHCSRELATFLHSLDDINWFKNLGKEPSSGISANVSRYLDVTGNKNCPTKILKTWKEAKVAAKSAKSLSLDGSNELEVRKIMREKAAIVHSQKVCIDSLALAFDHISKISHRITVNVPSGLASVPKTDFLPKAAAGAIGEAAYDNALWLLTGDSADHPAHLKFTLFAGGRWPIGLGEKNFYLW